MSNNTIPIGGGNNTPKNQNSNSNWSPISLATVSIIQEPVTTQTLVKNINTNLKNKVTGLLGASVKIVRGNSLSISVGVEIKSSKAEIDPLQELGLNFPEKDFCLPNEIKTELVNAGVIIPDVPLNVTRETIKTNRGKVQAYLIELDAVKVINMILPKPYQGKKYIIKDFKAGQKGNQAGVILFAQIDIKNSKYSEE